MRLMPLVLLKIIFLSGVQGDSSIDAEIEQIMNAKSSERYKLMNEFKSKLATMKRNERNEALRKLSKNKSLNKQGGNIIQPMQQPSVFQQHKPMQQQIGPSHSQQKR